MTCFRIAIVCSVASSLLAQEKRLRIGDNFEKDSRSRYQTRGDVAWEKGKLLFSPGGRIVASTRCGPDAVIGAEVRLPKGDSTAGLMFMFLIPVRAKTGRPPYRVAGLELRREKGEVVLINRSGFPRRANLGKHPEDAVWRVKFRFRTGVAWSMAWKKGDPQPKVWQAVGDTKEPTWEPSHLMIDAPKVAGGGELSFWSLAASPPTPPLSADKQKLADEAQRRESAGNSLDRKGRYPEALAEARQALKLRQEAYGSGHFWTAVSRRQVAIFLRHSGRYTESLRVANEAYSTIRKLYGDQHPALSPVLLTRAAAASWLGDDATAERSARQSLALSKAFQRPDDDRTLESSAFLGQILANAGKFEEAQQHMVAAVRAQRLKGGGRDHYTIAVGLNNLGELMREAGQFDHALRYQSEAASMMVRLFGKTHPSSGMVFNNLALVYASIGDYALARKYYEEALSARRATLPGNHPALATTLHNYGALCNADFKFKKSKELLEEALAVRRQSLGSHYRTATTLNFLALAQLGLGNRGVARGYALESLEMLQKTLPKGHWQRATGWNSLGAVEIADDELTAAMKCFERAYAIEKASLGGEHPKTLWALANVGSVHAELGDAERAWRAYFPAVRGFARVIRRHSASGSERDAGQRRASLRSVFETAVGLAAENPSLVSKFGPQLAEVVFEMKSGVSQGVIARREAVLMAGDPKLLATHRKLQDVRRQIARLSLRGPKGGKIATWQRRIAVLDEVRKRHERNLGEVVTTMGLVRQRFSAGFDQIVGQLKRGDALIQWVKYQPYTHVKGSHTVKWGDHRYIALIVQPPRGENQKPSVQLVPVGKATAVDRAVRDWRTAAKFGPVDAASNAELRKFVWAPIASRLKEDVRRLFLIPAGSLCLIPHAAVQSSDGKFLVERFEIACLSNARDLMPAATRVDSHGPPVVVSNPAYELDGKPSKPADELLASRASPGDILSSQGVRFRSLPGFAREQSALESIWRQTAPGRKLTVYSGKRATEEALESVKRPEFLYFITHGFFLPQDVDVPVADADSRGFQVVARQKPKKQDTDAPSRPVRSWGIDSGLALTGANQWKKRSDAGVSDGLLTAMEVEGLDLLGTKLVVLSACETGLGQVEASIGEGVLGLRRAFQNAGAKHVLASLWKVPDAETQRLMTGFFKRWSKGTRPSAALRAAQLELIAQLRKSSDKRRKQAPPLYWAGFVSHGK